MKTQIKHELLHYIEKSCQTRKKRKNLSYLVKKHVLMKLFSTLGLLFFSVSAHAQIGINTNSPKATLDITVKKETLSIEGLIPPRLTLEELTAKGNTLYGAEQEGTIIYILNTNGGNKEGQRENIDSKGLYIFDSEAENNEGRWMCLFCYGFV